MIPSAQPVPNPIGTAPGWYVHDENGVIVAMPGVPREMFRMWTEQLQPRISTLRFGPRRPLDDAEDNRHRRIDGRATLDALVKRADPVIATYAKDDGVHVRITAVAETDHDAAATRRDACVNRIEDLIGGLCLRPRQDTLPGAAWPAQRSALDAPICDAGGGGRFASLLAAKPGADPTTDHEPMQPSLRRASRASGQHICGRERCRPSA